MEIVRAWRNAPPPGMNRVKVTDVVKLLDVNIDSKLNFKKHIEKMCKTATQKSKALFRVRYFLSFEQAKTLVTSYIMSNFSYCPLIWMFRGKISNTLINKTHKRALTVLHKRFDLDFEELLNLESYDKVHTINLRFLLTEVFKSLIKLNPELMWQLFEIKENNYVLRNGLQLKALEVKTNRYGVNSLIFQGTSLWNTVKSEIKDSPSLEVFIKKIKSWDSIKCNCTICS